jgi:hypothetical protein
MTIWGIAVATRNPTPSRAVVLDAAQQLRLLGVQTPGPILTICGLSGLLAFGFGPWTECREEETTYIRATSKQANGD